MISKLNYPCQASNLCTIWVFCTYMGTHEKPMGTHRDGCTILKKPITHHGLGMGPKVGPIWTHCRSLVSTAWKKWSILFPIIIISTDLVYLIYGIRLFCISLYLAVDGHHL